MKLVVLASVFMIAAAVDSCATTAPFPTPAPSPAPSGGLPAADYKPVLPGLACAGDFVQGGFLLCQADRGALVSMGGATVKADNFGRVALGIHRDAPRSQTLSLKQTVSGRPEASTEVAIAQFDWDVEYVDGAARAARTYTDAEWEHIRRSTELKKAAFASASDGDAWTGGFVLPTRDHTRISGVFGSQRIYDGQKGNFHNGLDMAAPTGTPIYAPAGGVVRLAADLFFEGQCVFLDHGGGLMSVFMHMSEMNVSVGDRIEPGELIGKVGSTGRSTGPHLHWSIKWADRAYVDPERALAFNNIFVGGNLDGPSAMGAGR